MSHSTRMSTTLRSPPTLAPLRTVNASSSSGDTVDITKSRTLLKRISESALTPRRRALARKASKMFDQDTVTSGSRSASPSSTPIRSNGSSPSMTSQRSTEELKLASSLHDFDNTEERTTLFEFPKSEIFTFDDNTNMTDSTSQGRLLGHGKFEVFQLHQQRVTYIQCGSVVHPILPRLKILKISRNQFILPLSNPERYWRIVIATGDESILKQLETSFTKVCQFRNLFIQTAASQDEPINPLMTDTPFKSVPITDHPPAAAAAAAASPIKRNEQLPKSDSLSSITTTVACFNLESDTSTFVEEHHDPFNSNPLHKTTSQTSTLDLALESFFEESETTQYYTPDPSMVMSHNNHNVSRDTITLSPALLQIHSLHLPKRRSQSRSSRSTSLYQSESSWMDPTDDGNNNSVSTSTPATQRYLKMNLNPTPKTSKISTIVPTTLRSTSLNESQSLVRSGTGNDRSKYRYSSMDVYKMVKESSVEEISDGDASFGSFLKSWF